MLKVKDPQSTRAFGFDWSSYLASIGPTTTIVASTWAYTGADRALTVSSPSIVTGGLKTQTFVAGGTLGLTYSLTNHITTSSSPATVDERTIEVLIENE